MSASEIIAQIKALSREEQMVVSQFVRQELDSAPKIRYAADAQALAAGKAVVAEYPETFRRLSE